MKCATPSSVRTSPRRTNARPCPLSARCPGRAPPAAVGSALRCPARVCDEVRLRVREEAALFFVLGIAARRSSSSSGCRKSRTPRAAARGEPGRRGPPPTPHEQRVRAARGIQLASADAHPSARGECRRDGQRRAVEEVVGPGTYLCPMSASYALASGPSASPGRPSRVPPGRGRGRADHAAHSLVFKVSSDGCHPPRWREPSLKAGTSVPASQQSRLVLRHGARATKRALACRTAWSWAREHGALPRSVTRRSCCLARLVVGAARCQQTGSGAR